MPADGDTAGAVVIATSTTSARGVVSGSKGSAARAGQPAAGPAAASISPEQFPLLHVMHRERKEAVVYFATRSRPGTRAPELCFPVCVGQQRRTAAYAVVLGAPWSRPVPLYDAKAVWEAGLEMGGDASKTGGVPWGRWSAEWCKTRRIKEYLDRKCRAPITRLPQRIRYADGCTRRRRGCPRC